MFPYENLNYSFSCNHSRRFVILCHLLVAFISQILILLGYLFGSFKIYTITSFLCQIYSNYYLAIKLCENYTLINLREIKLIITCSSFIKKHHPNLEHYLSLITPLGPLRFHAIC